MISRALLVVAVVATSACGPTARSMALPARIQIHESQGLLPNNVPHIVGDSHARYFERGVARAKALGVKDVFVEELPAPYQNNLGLYFYHTKTIYIEIAQSKNNQLGTLFHEIAHHLQPIELRHTVNADVFAEAVAFLVCERLKLDSVIPSFSYLRLLPRYSETVMKYAWEIDGAAETILKGLR